MAYDWRAKWQDRVGANHPVAEVFEDDDGRLLVVFKRFGVHSSYRCWADGTCVSGDIAGDLIPIGGVQTFDDKVREQMAKEQS